jgi:hypothetical protein
VLDVVDFVGIERRVIEKNLDAVRAGADEAANGPDVEKVGQASGTSVVVAAVS